MLNLEINDNHVVPPESLSFNDMLKNDGVYEAESGCGPKTLIIVSDERAFVARYNGILLVPKKGHGWETLRYRLTNKSAVFSNKED